MSLRFPHQLRNKISNFGKSVDLVFLVFLLLILNVSLVVKLVGIIFIYLVRPNFKFEFKKGRLPLFYPLIIVLSIIQIVILFNTDIKGNVVHLLGLIFWAASLLVMHQLRRASENIDTKKVENAISCFFIINAVVCFYELLKIMFEVNSMNPYSFDGFNYKYSASTGDYIKGVMFDISTANMIINSFGIFYFLYQRKYLLSFICHVVAIYTTSNLGNFILVLFFACVLIFDASKFNKSLIICYLTFAVIFIIKISPSNLHYLNVKAKDLLHLSEKPITTHWHDNSEKDNLIRDYVKQKKGDLVLKKTSKELVNNLIIEKKKLEEEKQLTENISAIKERNENRSRFVMLYNSLYADTVDYMYKNYYSAMPGKYLSFVETFNFSKMNAVNLLVGAGAGNFSSKLAYKVTNMGFTGRYLEKLKYIAPEFKKNHLKLSLSYFVQSPDEHSIINFPNSVFNQLLGEYGVIGLILFFIFYVGFYLKKFKRLTFGKIILPMCLLFLITDYWFESFTIVVVFELMMFIDIAKSEKIKQSIDE